MRILERGSSSPSSFASRKNYSATILCFIKCNIFFLFSFHHARDVSRELFLSQKSTIIGAYDSLRGNREAEASRKNRAPSSFASRKNYSACYNNNFMIPLLSSIYIYICISRDVHTYLSQVHQAGSSIVRKLGSFDSVSSTSRFPLSNAQRRNSRHQSHRLSSINSSFH